MYTADVHCPINYLEDSRYRCKLSANFFLMPSMADNSEKASIGAWHRCNGIKTFHWTTNVEQSNGNIVAAPPILYMQQAIPKKFLEPKRFHCTSAQQNIYLAIAKRIAFRDPPVWYLSNIGAWRARYCSEKWVVGRVLSWRCTWVEYVKRPSVHKKFFNKQFTIPVTKFSVGFVFYFLLISLGQPDYRFIVACFFSIYSPTLKSDS